MAGACAEECIPQLDIAQFETIYDELDAKVRERLNEDYDCKKINGATYAATWAAMMSPAVGQILSSIVALQNNETSADRCVKLANCDHIKEQTEEIIKESGRRERITVADVNYKLAQTSFTNAQEDEIAEESRRRDCLAEADCKIKAEQKGLNEQQKLKTLEEANNMRIRNGSQKQDILGNEVSYKDPSTGIWDVNSQPAQERLLIVEQKKKAAYEVTDVLPEQVALTTRQITGFNDNIRQKLFEAQMNAWAMMFSSGLLEEKPSIITNDSVTELYEKMVV